MMSSSALTKALKLSLALMIAAPLVMATDALAQRTKRSASLSKAYKKAYKNVPWQMTLDKYYRPIDPQSDIKKAKRTLLRDPGKLLGLPSHGIRRPTAPKAPFVAPVANSTRSSCVPELTYASVSVGSRSTPRALPRPLAIVVRPPLARSTAVSSPLPESKR